MRGINQNQVVKLLPAAAIFDLSLVVAVFGGYIDPTLRIIGAVSGAITAISMVIIYVRNMD